MFHTQTFVQYEWPKYFDFISLLCDRGTFTVPVYFANHPTVHGISESYLFLQWYARTISSSYCSTGLQSGHVRQVRSTRQQDSRTAVRWPSQTDLTTTPTRTSSALWVVSIKCYCTTCIDFLLIRFFANSGYLNFKRFTSLANYWLIYMKLVRVFECYWSTIYKWAVDWQILKINDTVVLLLQTDNFSQIFWIAWWIPLTLSLKETMLSDKQLRSPIINVYYFYFFPWRENYNWLGQWKIEIRKRFCRFLGNQCVLF